MIKKRINPPYSISDYSDLLILFSLIIAFTATSLFTFPAVGMWQLIDSEKLVKGFSLYGDVKTITPPVFYLFFLPFVKLGVLDLSFYRELGVIFLSATFLILYKVLSNYIKQNTSIILVFGIICIYLITPWELYVTYMYLASIFAILSLHFYYKSKKTALFFLVMSILSKITIGGSLAIGYILSVLLNTLFFKRRQSYYDKTWSAKATLIGCLLISAITPFLIFLMLGVHFDLSGFLTSSFSGESKGGLKTALINPIVSTYNFFNQFIDAPNHWDANDPRIYLQTFRLLYSYLGLSLIIALAYFLSVFVYGVETIRYALKRRWYRVIVYFPLIISLAGACYASSMSGNFKPDDILLFSFFVVLLYKYSARNSFYTWGLIFIVLICWLYGVSKTTFTVAVVDLIALISLLFVILDKRFRNYSIGLIFIFFIFFKCYSSTFNWWEINIKGKNVVGMYNGFFITPFYNDFVVKLDKLAKHAEETGTDKTVYSFPISSLPYHLFKALPITRYTTHHADVFPKSQVDNEFSLLSEKKPNFIVLSRWSSAKLKELDSIFAPHSLTSQHIMGIKLEGLIASNYEICSVVKSNENPSIDSFNHPFEIYIKREIFYTKHFNDFCKTL